MCIKNLFVLFRFVQLLCVLRQNQMNSLSIEKKKPNISTIAQSGIEYYTSKRANESKQLSERYKCVLI